MLAVITGGSGSGKSEYAEQLLAQYAVPGRQRYYLATMQPYGTEGAARIQKHRMQRAGRNFITIEQYTDIEKAKISVDADVLLECMSNLAANELFDAGGAGRTAEEVSKKIRKGIRRLYQRCTHLVIVTNEIFSDGIPYDRETQEYIRCLGLINQRLYAEADVVTEVVYSIPVHLKGGS